MLPCEHCREPLPELKQTLKEGWHHVFAFGLLTFMLLVMQNEQYAPFYATAALLVINQIVSKTDRWGRKEVLHFIDSLARLFATLAATLRARRVDTTLFYGGRRADDLFHVDTFESLGVHLRLATDDGSRGDHGRADAFDIQRQQRQIAQ